jgi:hypothetical protein
MAIPWVGEARILFIPFVAPNLNGYLPVPDDYLESMVKRVVYDPAPDTGEDRSLASMIASFSGGLARIEPTVSNLITLDAWEQGENPTSLAISAHPRSHEYDYLAVIYPPNLVNAGGGQAVRGRFQFDPPRTPNVNKGRCRFRHDEPIGVWMMEIMHIVTDITDFYNTLGHPARFEAMAAAGGSHPTSFTKNLAGWYEDRGLVRQDTNSGNHRLHAVGLGVAPPGRVSGVIVQAPGSNRHLVVEARIKTDRWEAGFSGSTGIPSEGVVVYEAAPDDDPWPRINNPGPLSPLQLRTLRALRVGETFEHHDPWTRTGGPRDHRSGRGRNRTIPVVYDLPGGFRVRITTDAPE